MKLPSPIQTYFDADERNDALIHVFAPDAVVKDEGQPYSRTKVTGQFPGSPVTRTFTFRLKGDRIVGLDIGE